MVLFHFIWAGLGAEFGRAEATVEGLVFANRPSREPPLPKLSEPEQDQRRGQREAGDFGAMSMNRGGRVPQSPRRAKRERR